MKYYSEKLDEIFESEKELNDAESAILKKEAEEEKQLSLTKKEKKELAKAVDEAEEKLNEAYSNYDVAREEASKIMAEAKEKCKEILEPAKTAIKEAERAKWDAIVAFNGKFGRYMKVYTGDEALREFKKANNWLDNLFNSLWF